MQLRRLTCTSVLLACAIAVFAAPAPSPKYMTERDVDQDVEARNWDSEDMIPRYNNVEDHVRLLSRRNLLSFNLNINAF